MDIQPNISGEQKACIRCQQPISAAAKFCNHCGALQLEPDFQDARLQQSRLFLLAIFFGIELVVCLIANFDHDARGLWALFTFDAILSTVTLGFAFYLRKEIVFLLRWKNFSVIKALGYASLAILGAVIVHYSVTWMNRSIFDTEEYYYFAFSQLRYAKIVTVLVVALQPALFEELAFRGVMQQGLMKVIDPQQALFVSAFLFALLHMSFVSFFWLLPFAYLLGRVRLKEKTLWYGVLIHFCFNTTACFLEFFELHLFNH